MIHHVHVHVHAWIILKIFLGAIIEKFGWDSLSLIIEGSTKTKTKTKYKTSEEAACNVKH